MFSILLYIYSNGAWTLRPHKCHFHNAFRAGSRLLCFRSLGGGHISKVSLRLLSRRILGHTLYIQPSHLARWSMRSRRLSLASATCSFSCLAHNARLAAEDNDREDAGHWKAPEPSHSANNVGSTGEATECQGLIAGEEAVDPSYNGDRTAVSTTITEETVRKLKRDKMTAGIRGRQCDMDCAKYLDTQRHGCAKPSLAPSTTPTSQHRHVSQDGRRVYSPSRQVFATTMSDALQPPKNGNDVLATEMYKFLALGLCALWRSHRRVDIHPPGPAHALIFGPHRDHTIQRN